MKILSALCEPRRADAASINYCRAAAARGARAARPRPPPAARGPACCDSAARVRHVTESAGVTDEQPQ